MGFRWWCAGLVLFACATAQAGEWRWPPQRSKVGKTRPVELPLNMSDGVGGQVAVGPDGALGNLRGFGEAGSFRLEDGFVYGSQDAHAQFDPARNEVILPTQTHRNLRVSRRVSVDSKLGLCRWTEILENPSANRVSADVTVQFSMGESPDQTRWLDDPKHEGAPIGVAFGMEGRGCVFVCGGPGSRTPPRISRSEDSDAVMVSWSVTIPPKQKVVLTHMAAVRRTFGEACRTLDAVRESDLMAGVPPELARYVANCRNSRLEVAGVEVLRGDVYDVVELRSGDQIVGTIDQPSMSVKTDFGLVKVDCARLAGVIAAPGSRPRHILVLADGQAISGELQIDRLNIRRTDEQTIGIPVQQVYRIGWRRRGVKDDAECKLERPSVLLATGDRLWIDKPEGELEVATRYGRLKLPASAVGAVTFGGDDATVAFHEVRLVDGTRLAGLVERNSIDVRLAGELAGKSGTFELPAVSRLIHGPYRDEPDGTAPVLQLANGDVLSGPLEGKLKLDAGFAQLEIDCSQIKRLTYTKGTAADVTVTLWDDSTAQGVLEKAQIQCAIAGGAKARVPIGMLAMYDNPRPALPAAALAEAKGLVEKFAAGDATSADRLAAFGGSTIAILKAAEATAQGDAKKSLGDLAEQFDRQFRRETSERPTLGPAIPFPPAEAAAQDKN